MPIRKKFSVNFTVLEAYTAIHKLLERYTCFVQFKEECLNSLLNAKEGRKRIYTLKL